MFPFLPQSVEAKAPYIHQHQVAGRISPRFDIFLAIGSHQCDRSHGGIDGVITTGGRRIDGAEALPYKPQQPSGKPLRARPAVLLV